MLKGMFIRLLESDRRYGQRRISELPDLMTVQILPMANVSDAGVLYYLRDIVVMIMMS
jgi:hypothetical protein